MKEFIECSLLSVRLCCSISLNATISYHYASAFPTPPPPQFGSVCLGTGHKMRVKKIDVDIVNITHKDVVHTHVSHHF